MSIVYPTHTKRGREATILNNVRSRYQLGDEVWDASAWPVAYFEVRKTYLQALHSHVQLQSFDRNSLELASAMVGEGGRVLRDCMIGVQYDTV